MTSSPPAFSIVTATYNPGAALERTIDCLGKQTVRDFEWIVIDGASTDGTVDRLRALGPLLSHWISEPDDGIADAWNKGIARARGRHVLILNAGDTYDPHFLEKVGAVADGRRIVCCHARLLKEDGTEVGRLRAQPHKLYRAMHVPHNWCAVPRHRYAELGNYQKLPQAMDFEWFHRYFRRYGPEGFIVIDEALGDYRLGGTSDLNFAESFRTKEQIIVANGGNRWRARGYRWAYTVKHAIRRLFL